MLLVHVVVDNLFQQAVIAQDLVAISFEPTTSVKTVNGELTFGGTDPTKFIGSIDFVYVTSVFKFDLCTYVRYRPVTTTAPSNRFWGIEQEIRYGTNTDILAPTAGIVDTGTTLTMIASGMLYSTTIDRPS